MPRKLTFDPVETLDTAMRQFWLHGYANSSLDTLVAVTGVNRYGLYTVFGDKQGMFIAALDRYRDTVVASRLRDLEQTSASWLAIREYFFDILRSAAADKQRFGCLMCNTASELAAHDAVIADRVSTHLDRLSAAFLRALRSAKANGEIGADIDPVRSAAFLVGVSQGLFVLARIGSMESMRHTVDIALSTIHWSGPTQP